MSKIVKDLLIERLGKQTKTIEESLFADIMRILFERKQPGEKE